MDIFFSFWISFSASDDVEEYESMHARSPSLEDPDRIVWS